MHILEWFSTLIAIVIDEKFHPAHLLICMDLLSGHEIQQKVFPTFNNDFYVYSMRLFKKYMRNLIPTNSYRLLSMNSLDSRHSALNSNPFSGD